MFTRMVSALIAIAAFATPVAAQFVPVGQKRYIFESIGEEFFINQATDFGPFDAAFTKVGQTSIIGPESITGIGFAGPDPFFSLNSATSFFELVFTVEQPTFVIFSGEIHTGMFGSGSANLTGESGAIVDLIADEFASVAWNQPLELSPGQYSLEVFVSNSIGADLSTFEFALTVPSPGALAAMLVAVVGARSRKRRP